MQLKLQLIADATGNKVDYYQSPILNHTELKDLEKELHESLRIRQTSYSQPSKETSASTNRPLERKPLAFPRRVDIVL
jgi:hypothetical protein